MACLWVAVRELTGGTAREAGALDPPDSPNLFTVFTFTPACSPARDRDMPRWAPSRPVPGMPSARSAPSSVKEAGADRALPRRTLGQAEQEVVLQVELEVEVELVLVQPASTTSLASE